MKNLFDIKDKVIIVTVSWVKVLLTILQNKVPKS